MFGLGTNELIVIGVVIFIIFGAKRLPEIVKGLGGAIRPSLRTSWLERSQSRYPV